MKLFVPLVVVVLLRSIAFEWSSLLGLVQSPSFNYLEFVRLISDLLQSLFFLLLLQLERLLKKWQTLITRAKLIIQYATFPYTNVRVGAEKRSNARRPVSVLSPMGWANKKQFAFYKMAHRPITPHQNPSELEINITWLRWAFDQVSYRWTYFPVF